MTSRILTLCAIALGLSILLPVGSAMAAGAADDHTVLILASTSPGGISHPVPQECITLGYNVELATDAQWAAKSTADFSTYRALIFADPYCTSGLSLLSAAIANAATWGPAVDGNILILGTDLAFHGQFLPGPVKLRNAGLSYVLSTPPSQNRTGLYVVLSCYYDNVFPAVPVTVLSYFGTFMAQDNQFCDQFSPHITAPTHPAMAPIVDADLTGWDCSYHALFTKWPSNFQVLTIARNYGSAYTAPDGSVGTPYILARTATECPVLPSINLCGANPDVLWPPDHKMIDITVCASVIGTGVTVTRTITCSEVPKKPWTVFYEDGPDIWHFKLRADRNGEDDGRVYTITYKGVDACGNQTQSSVTVTVPHDQGKKDKDD